MRIMQELFIRQADFKDEEVIWAILQDGIRLRKLSGSSQWQNNYPNPDTVHEDIRLQRSFIFELNQQIIATVVIDLNGEPAYDAVKSWQSASPYATIHRLAIRSSFAGKGLGALLFQTIEKYVKFVEIQSIRMDTSEDNIPMIHLLEKMHYDYRGDVYYGQDKRVAFEKIL